MSRLPQEPSKARALLDAIDRLLRTDVVIPVPPGERFKGYYSNLLYCPRRTGHHLWSLISKPKHTAKFCMKVLSHGVNHRSSSLCSTSSQGASMEHSLSLETQIHTSRDSPVVQDQSVSPLVDSHQSPDQGQTSRVSSVAPPLYGCKPIGLGSSPGGTFSTGPLVSSRATSPHQPLGDSSHLSSLSPLTATTSGSGGKNPIRQCHNRSICQSPRRNKKQECTKLSWTDLSMGRDLPSTASQLGGGLSQQTIRRSKRVVSKGRRFSPTHSKMGNSRGRPHGNPATLLRSIQGPSGYSSGCPDHYLKFPARLCLPSSAEGAHHSHSHCSQMASSHVLLGSSKSIRRPPMDSTHHSRSSVSGANSAPMPSQPLIDGVALETVIIKKKGFSDAIILRMRAARKPVSAKTYHRVWSTYHQWCQCHGVDFLRLSIANLLAFLQERLSIGLSLGSLKSQISDMSILFQRRLALHSDVKTFLQGVAHVKPPVRSPVPTWDLSLVLRSLQRPHFEPLSSISLQWLTWKTVFLNAIALARQVWEMSALSCRSPFLTFHQDRVVLCTIPSSLPNVVSSFHLNQEPFQPSVLLLPILRRWPFIPWTTCGLSSTTCTE
ncbi:uncharacterized protein LOC121401364 [Xenopus laevis]|uniref:Uncharacterized protein LOC121401364 n=1 Tax=Xenopus laevis TaxID=8355 RepID=A0A8J1MJ64_XENLA|nr:uncharacterized protein LOC121401364 [Xenopus laevis]